MATNRIGTCRKKVMGLLRLMGNKADVVKGLYKRCNENWSVAPKSDIVRYPSFILSRSPVILLDRFCHVKYVLIYTIAIDTNRVSISLIFKIISLLQPRI
jgi:hypothetical protein